MVQRDSAALHRDNDRIQRQMHEEDADRDNQVHVRQAGGAERHLRAL